MCKYYFCTLAFVLLTFFPLQSSCETLILESFHYPPYLYKENDIQGAVAEIVEVIFEETSHDVHFEFYPMKRAITTYSNDLHNRIIVRAKGSFINENMEEHSVYIPLFNVRWAFLIRVDSTDIKDLEDLKGRSIGELRGSNNIEIFRKHSKRVHEVSSHESIIKMLKIGRVDVMSSLDLTLLDIVGRHFPLQKDMFKLSTYKKYDPLVLVIDKNNHQMIAFLQNRVRQLIENGTIKQILEKYYNGAVPPNILLTVDDIE
ncbi:substrate-binding periplasmic protein [Maridesulfovibrio sp.]|uniref:substrate-binding periplasmic protein n=1 Tax=unclassified Maridesulfovibrio TaxID=2794999 RepID=UPI003AFFF532